MQYRALGRTGLQVSILALGGSSFGSAFRPVDEADAIRTVHAALDHGINLIDTAPFYGLTVSEKVIGKALLSVPRDRFLLSTKVARYGRNIGDFDFSAKRTAASVDESLTRLGLEHVDIVFVHDIEFGDLEQVARETLPALHGLKAAGKVRFAGISGLPLRAFHRVLDHAEVDVIQSYCHYCLNDTALTGLLPQLREKGIGVFNSAPLAMRLLSDEGPPDWHPAPAALRAKCAEAAAYCRARGASLGRLALQFALANPEIHTHVVGTGRPERVLENLRDAGAPRDEALLRAVQAILAPVHNVTWPSGRPENN